MDQIQLKRGKLASWLELDPILAAGEAGVVFDDTTLAPVGIKIGNGTLKYSELPWIGAGEPGPGPSDTYTKEQIDQMFESAAAQTNEQINSLSIAVVKIETLGTNKSVLKSYYIDEINKHIMFSLQDLSNGSMTTSDFTELLLQDGVLTTLNIATADQVNTVSATVDRINSAVPSTASPEDPLVQLSTVESLIARSTGDVVTASATGENFATVAALNAGPWYVKGTQVEESEIKQNSSAVVSSDENHNNQQTKYIWTGTVWKYDGTISSGAFTSEQWAAINSGVSKTVLTNINTQIDKNKSDIATEKSRAETAEQNLSANQQKILQDVANNKLDIAQNASDISNLETELETKLDKTQAFKNQFLGTDNNGDITNVNDAPLDGKQYTRKNGDWSELTVLTSDPTITQINETLNALGVKDSELESGLSVVQRVIPDSATETNKLVDQQTMTAAIAANAGRSLASNTQGDPFPTYAALTAAQSDDPKAFYYGDTRVDPQTNDITVVLSDETRDGATTQYVFQNNSWVYRQTLSSISFTDSQMAAINSGITEQKVTEFSTHITAAENELANKANKIPNYATTARVIVGGSGYVSGPANITFNSQTYAIQITASGGAVTTVNTSSLPKSVNFNNQTLGISQGSATGATAAFTSIAAFKDLLDVRTELDSKITNNSIAISAVSLDLDAVETKVGTTALATTAKNLSDAVNELKNSLGEIELTAEKVSYTDDEDIGADTVQKAITTTVEAILGRWRASSALITTLGAVNTLVLSSLTAIGVQTSTTPVVGQIISDRIGTEAIITNVSSTSVTANTIFLNTPESLAAHTESEYTTLVQNSDDTIIQRVLSAVGGGASSVRFAGKCLELLDNRNKIISFRILQPGDQYQNTSGTNTTISTDGGGLYVSITDKSATGYNFIKLADNSQIEQLNATLQTKSGLLTGVYDNTEISITAAGSGYTVDQPVMVGGSTGVKGLVIEVNTTGGITKLWIPSTFSQFTGGVISAISPDPGTGATCTINSKLLSKDLTAAYNDLRTTIEVLLASRLERGPIDGKMRVVLDRELTPIFLSSTTKYVDATNDGDQNGLEFAPYKTVLQAMSALGTDGGAISIAAGEYTGEITVNGKNVNFIGDAVDKNYRTFLKKLTITGASSVGIKDLSITQSLSFSGTGALYLDNVSVTQGTTINGEGYFRRCDFKSTVNITSGNVLFEDCDFEGVVIQISGEGTVVTTKNCTGVTVNAIGGSYIQLSGQCTVTSDSEYAIRATSAVKLVALLDGEAYSLDGSLAPISIRPITYRIGAFKFDKTNSILNGTRAVADGLSASQVYVSVTGETTEYLNTTLSNLQSLLQNKSIPIAVSESNGEYIILMQGNRSEYSAIAVDSNLVAKVIDSTGEIDSNNNTTKWEITLPAESGVANFIISNETGVSVNDTVSLSSDFVLSVIPLTSGMTRSEIQGLLNQIRLEITTLTSALNGALATINEHSQSISNISTKLTGIESDISDLSADVTDLSTKKLDSPLSTNVATGDIPVINVDGENKVTLVSSGIQSSELSNIPDDLVFDMGGGEVNDSKNGLRVYKTDRQEITNNAVIHFSNLPSDKKCSIPFPTNSIIYNLTADDSVYLGNFKSIDSLNLDTNVTGPITLFQSNVGLILYEASALTNSINVNLYECQSKIHFYYDAGGPGNPATSWFNITAVNSKMTITSAYASTSFSGFSAVISMTNSELIVDDIAQLQITEGSTGVIYVNNAGARISLVEGSKCIVIFTVAVDYATVLNSTESKALAIFNFNAIGGGSKLTDAIEWVNTIKDTAENVNGIPANVIKAAFQGYSESDSIETKLSKKAPILHTADSSLYGAASQTLFGHVKLSKKNVGSLPPSISALNESQLPKYFLVKASLTDSTTVSPRLNATSVNWTNTDNSSNGSYVANVVINNEAANSEFPYVVSVETYLISGSGDSQTFQQTYDSPVIACPGNDSTKISQTIKVYSNAKISLLVRVSFL